MSEERLMFEANRKINQKELESQSFYQKWAQTSLLIGLPFTDPKLKEDKAEWFVNLSILDIGLLGIPRVSAGLIDQLEKPWVDSSLLVIDEEAGAYTFIRKVLMGLIWLPIIAQTIIAVALSVVAFPFVLVVNYLYPQCRNDNGNVIDPALALAGQKRRRFWFNPSTWVFFMLLAAGSSFLIQWANPALFLEAAAPLLMIQGVLASFAMITLVGATIGGLYAFIQEKRSTKPIKLLVDDEAVSEKLEEPSSGVLEYLREFSKWCGENRVLAGITIGVGVLCVLAVLALTIGFLTDGFGLFPGSFAFMAPVFEFIASGLTYAIHSASALPGLEFLGSASDFALQVMSQIMFVSTLLLAAIFVPDNIRRALTLLPGSSDQGDQLSLSDEDSNSFQPADYDHCFTKNVNATEKGEISVDAGTKCRILSYEHRIEFIKAKVYVELENKTQGWVPPGCLAEIKRDVDNDFRANQKGPLNSQSDDESVPEPIVRYATENWNISKEDQYGLPVQFANKLNLIDYDDQESDPPYHLSAGQDAGDGYMYACLASTPDICGWVPADILSEEDPTVKSTNKPSEFG